MGSSKLKTQPSIEDHVKRNSLLITRLTQHRVTEMRKNTATNLPGLFRDDDDNSLPALGDESFPSLRTPSDLSTPSSLLAEVLDSSEDLSPAPQSWSSKVSPKKKRQ